MLQFADKFGTIVQAAVPRDDSSGTGNVWLAFAMRLLRYVKSAIENLYSALGIRLVAVRSVPG